MHAVRSESLLVIAFHCAMIAKQANSPHQTGNPMSFTFQLCNTKLNYNLDSESESLQRYTATSHAP